MKGYPRSRFEILDQTQVQEIQTETLPNPTAVIMATYTSDKGSEDWELMYGLTEFTNRKGGLSFTKHGQPQLLVAECLRNGAYVFGKRMVSRDATLANVTVKAKVVVANNVSYVYFYTSSAVSVGNMAEAAESGYGNFDPSDKDLLDFPLFTVTAAGRGASSLFFRINPEYSTSKSSTYIKYSFEVYENQELIESILFTMNPDIVIDGTSQSVQAKVNANSGQVKVKLFEDGVLSFITKLAETAKTAQTPIPVSTLVNMDFINGMDRRGQTAIGGVVTKAQSAAASDLWTTNKPSDITKVYSLSDLGGIPLTNGSNGSLGNAPITNTAEYERLLLGAYGKDRTSEQYDPIIYDVDAFKPDAIFDCAYSTTVKNAIIDVVDFRGDLVFLADLGTTHTTLDAIISAAKDINPSRYCAVYHNYMDIADPYTKKDITVTAPLLLASRLIKHISDGVGRPFAGIANSIYFPEIIEGSINFLPVEIPGEDQKQALADASINYISYYDGTPVMETMYTNNDEYTQLSYLHNILAIQEIIKVIRARCPRTRYTFLDGDDLEEYITDAQNIIKQYSTNFRSIDIQYMADEKYESNNIFYATIVVQFKNFIQEEYFKIIAIS